jgi:uncharacterized protein (TIGR00290 family)
LNQTTTNPTSTNTSTIPGLTAGMKTICSWSGGKDCGLALKRAVDAGADVQGLLTMFIEDGQRSRSHGLKPEIIRKQAQMLGTISHQRATSWADYQANFIDMLKALKAQGVEAVVFGDIDLDDHRKWEEMVCKAAGLTPLLPLWKEPRRKLVEEVLSAGFSATIVATQDKTIGDKYLGRVLDHDLLREFEAIGIDACGENGEFHTVVTNGPGFKAPIRLTPGQKVLRDGVWFLDLSV